jgi:hypothetical protein
MVIMNNEFLSKYEALHTALNLSKKEKKAVFVVLYGCGYTVTENPAHDVGAAAAIIAHYDKGKQIFPEIEEPAQDEQ